MRLFGTKKKEKSSEQSVVSSQKKATPKKSAQKTSKKPVKKPRGKKAAPAKTIAASNSAVFSEKILLRPHVTEKAAQLTAKSVYTFEIAPRATKRDVAAAVKAVYRVTPRKIAVVTIPAKRVRLRKKRGFGARAAVKKAYVYLKEGDRIEFSS